MMKLIAQVICLAALVQFCSCDDSSLDANYPGETVIDKYPVWSPSGNQILYAGGDGEDGGALYLIDTNGANKKIVSSTSYWQTDFSPDGQWIVYSDGGQIRKRKLSDSTDIQLTFEGSNYYPSWSRDGEWIAFDSDNDSPNGMNFVWKMRADGTDKKRIIYSPYVGEVREPDWFPDGIRLAVIRYVGHGAPEIAVIDTSGNSVSLLTNDDKFDRSPKVSGDGNFIAYYRDDRGGQICIVKYDGTNFRQITNGSSLCPNWSPDGRMIVYTSSVLNDGRIWIMNKDGTSPRRISH